MTTPADAMTEAPLVVVRYGLAKEIQLFSDALVFISREEGEADRFPLTGIRKMLLQPGDKTPSKLLLLLEFDDGTPIIVAEGMTNVRDFRTLLARLPEVAPHIQLDPPDMDAQLVQALQNRRQASIGCYGVSLVFLLLLALALVAGNFLIHH